LCDIYFCRLDGPNALYRNLGNWKFEDFTASAGVACENQYSTGAVLADVDGDGDLDLLVNGIGAGTRLFLNNGKGKFTEATAAGLVRKYGATSIWRTWTLMGIWISMWRITGQRLFEQPASLF
jgi:hypothetical protein